MNMKKEFFDVAYTFNFSRDIVQLSNIVCDIDLWLH